MERRGLPGSAGQPTFQVDDTVVCCVGVPSAAVQSILSGCNIANHALLKSPRPHGPQQAGFNAKTEVLNGTSVNGANKCGGQGTSGNVSKRAQNIPILKHTECS